jgi:hypothetical protein
MLGLLLLQTGKISLQTFAYDWNETLPPPLTPTYGWLFLFDSVLIFNPQT